MSRRSKTLVVVGDRAVGKSSLVHRLLEEPVDFTTYNPTIDDNYSAAWKLPSKLKGLKLKRGKRSVFCTTAHYFGERACASPVDQFEGAVPTLVSNYLTSLLLHF